MNIKKVYKILDDCHTELAKSSVTETKEYNELSTRIIEAKTYLISMSEERYFLDFLQWCCTQKDWLNTPIIKTVEGYLQYIEKQK